MFSKKKFFYFFLFLQSYYSSGAESFSSQGFFGWDKKDPIEITGDLSMILLPTTSFILNLTLEEDYKGFKENLLATGVNLLSTSLLKLLLDKAYLGNYELGRRPNGEHYNMPSGHTSIVFTSSFHVLKRYGFLPSLPFLGLACFTAFSRVHARKHDVAAVLAGAVLGIGTSLLFTSRYKNSKIIFNLNPASREISLSYSRVF